MKLSSQKYIENMKLAKELLMVYRFDTDLEKAVMDAIMEHREEGESGLETFLRLLQTAEYAMLLEDDHD